MSAFGRMARRGFAYFLFFIAFLLFIPVVSAAHEWPLALFMSAAAGGVGWLVLRGLRREETEYEGAEAIKRQLAVLQLAEATDGSLTVTEVAARLGWPLEVAQTTLRSLDDGVRVTCTLTDEGIFLYEFPELTHDPTRMQNLRRSLAEREAAAEARPRE